jgi:hypothetical protein
MVDATIVIQMCNFCAVWAALYTIVLKRVFVIIAHKHEQQKKIQDSCASLQERIALLQSSRDKEWHAFHMQYIPGKQGGAARTCFFIDYGGIPTPSSTEHGVSALIAQLKKAIVRRLEESV